MSKFTFDTVKDFDNHISNSIFGYNILHQLIVNISSFFMKLDTVPIDLGCTSGKLLKEINDTYDCKSIGYDLISTHFIEGIDLRVQDIAADEFIIPNTNLIYCIFTLQFLPYSKRLSVLKKAFNALDKNGALIICEKETCENGGVQEVFIFSNYQYKQQAFTDTEILNKENSLRFIMNPMTTKENVFLLKKAGFKTIEPFFQSLNFKGYICIK